MKASSRLLGLDMAIESSDQPGTADAWLPTASAPSSVAAAHSRAASAQAERLAHVPCHAMWRTSGRGTSSSDF